MHQLAGFNQSSKAIVCIIQMIVKKVGHLLLIRLRLFEVLAKLTPLGIIASFVLIFFFFHLKEDFQFQQPSLRTRLEDVTTHSPDLTLNYIPIHEGIKFLKVPGAMDHQCLLLTIPQRMQNGTQIKNIYQTLMKDIYNSKNIIVLSYQSVEALSEFFEWYYNPQKNKNFSFGIIRAGLNVEFIPQNITNFSTKSENETKDKAFYHTYMPGLHPDLDYFYSLKDLMQLTLISWSPCQQIHKIPIYRHIKRYLLKLQKEITNKHDIKTFIQHALCQLHIHLFYQLSPHQVMMKQGFQAGTIKFLIGTTRQKPQQVVVSFLKEFSLQEDHLHSARVFFYPLSRTQQLPLNATLFPSLLFLLSVVIMLINRLVTKYVLSLSIKFETCIILYSWVWEYYFKKDNTYSLILAIIILIVGSLKDVFKGQDNFIQNGRYKKNLFQLIVEPFSALVALYHGLFCFPLSIISMFTTSILLFIPLSPKLKLLYKLTVFAALLFITTPSLPDFGLIFYYQLKVVILVMLLRLTM